MLIALAIESPIRTLDKIQADVWQLINIVIGFGSSEAAVDWHAVATRRIVCQEQFNHEAIAYNAVQHDSFLRFSINIPLFVWSTLAIHPTRVREHTRIKLHLRYADRWFFGGHDFIAGLYLPGAAVDWTRIQQARQRP